MSKSTSSETLGVHTRHEIIAEIKARGGAITMTKSAYAAHVLSWWHAQGCPPVLPVDEAMQRLRGKAVGNEKRDGRKVG